MSAPIKAKKTCKLYYLITRRDQSENLKVINQG